MADCEILARLASSDWERPACIRARRINDADELVMTKRYLIVYWRAEATPGSDLLSLGGAKWGRESASAPGVRFEASPADLSFEHLERAAADPVHVQVERDERVARFRIERK